MVRMSRSAIHRYAVTLLALGYLERSRARKYQLGSRVSDLGMSVLNTIPLRTHAPAYLQELRVRSRCTASPLVAVLLARRPARIDGSRALNYE